MKDAAGSRKFRRGKHLSHRDIHIRHTVFKISLFRHILKGMKVDDQICFIAVPALDLHPLAGIQRLDDRLLDPFIELIIQRIDLHDLPEDLREFLPDLRYRIGDNGKTAFIAFDIAVYDLAGLIIQFHLQLLLGFCERPGLRFRLR